MAEIIHEIPIEAGSARLYSMLTNEDFLSQWWLKGTKIEAKEGAIGTFPLSDGVNQITMRVCELVPNKKVVWQCLGHKFPEWNDTQVSFEISGEAPNLSLRFRHYGWKDTSGCFGKTSFYWASLYLQNLKRILEAQHVTYDWTKFEIYYYVKSPIERVFAAWATSAGLESFFVKAAKIVGKSGVKNPIVSAEVGDSYEWEWWHNYQSKGTYSTVAPNRTVSFSFGKCLVGVYLRTTEHGTEIKLVQSGMANTEDDRVNIHLDCRSGWLHFLANLKSTLEHGKDIRQLNPAIEGCVSVRFKGV